MVRLAVEMAAKMAAGEEHPIDLVFVDYHMKELTGAETVAQLRALCSSTVCIGVTGSSDGTCALSLEARKFLEAGCLD